jgi:hypothetical protein
LWPARFMLTIAWYNHIISGFKLYII